MDVNHLLGFNTTRKASAPRRALTTLKKMAEWPKTQQVPYETLRRFGGRGRVSAAYGVLMNRLRPKKTVLFFPKKPSQYQVTYKLCTLLGYRMHSSPDRPYDVAFAHEGATVYPTDHFRLLGDVRVINRDASDISKKRVEQAFEEIFGYSLSVDPATYTGLAVRKSNDNYRHDGEIVTCPYAATDDPALTHQRYIDTRTEDGFFLDIRVLVYRTNIPLVYLKHRPDTPDRFTTVDHSVVAMPEDVFSAEERERIVRLAQRMGTEYCEMDVMRDNNDGRIYVVDVNRAPAGPVDGMTVDQSRRILNYLAPHFEQLLNETQQ